MISNFLLVKMFRSLPSITSDFKMFRSLPSRTSRYVFIILFLAFAIPSTSSETESNTLSFSVKIKENVRYEIGLTNDNIIGTGITSVDLLHKRYNCLEMKQVFKGPFDSDAKAVGLDRIYHLKLRTKEKLTNVINEYRASKRFDYVTSYKRCRTMGSKAVKPNDKYYYRQWALHNDGTYTMGGIYKPKADADIDMPEAWEIEKGDSTIIIGIIDSGCKTKHKELAGRIWQNPGEIPGNNKDDDNNGYIDDVEGWNFVDTNNNVDDQLGHGTWVAGIIGANSNNTLGLAGINWHSKLMITKVIDSTETTLGHASLQAIKYSVDNGAHIINYSSSGYHNGSPVTEDAILYAYKKNVMVVASVGNRDTTKIGYPASNQYTFAVGATDPDDIRAKKFLTNGGRSSYGTGIDIVAPGNYINVLSITDENKYNTFTSGTSYSTAYVTGVASLLLSLNPKFTPDQLKMILRESAEDQVGDPTEDTKGWDKYYGHGRLNAHKALVLAQTSVKYPLHPVYVSPSVAITHNNGVLSFSSEGLGNWTRKIELFSLKGRQLYAQNNVQKNVFKNTLRINTHNISSQKVIYRLKGTKKLISGIVNMID